MSHFGERSSEQIDIHYNDTSITMKRVNYDNNMDETNSIKAKLAKQEEEEKKDESFDDDGEDGTNVDVMSVSDDEDEYSYTSDNDMVPSTPTTFAKGTPKYSFCTMEQAQTFMESTATQVTDMLGVTPTVASVLLRNYNWDTESLFQQYLAQDDNSDDECSQILAKCGVLQRATLGGTLLGGGKHDSDFTCLICFDNQLASDEVFGMACGHVFCKTCWEGYLTVAVDTDGQACIHLSCPASKCSEVVTREEFVKLQISPAVTSKYSDFLLRANIDSNWRMRWCPGPACSMVAVGNTADGLAGLSGQCTQCRTSFCLGCGEMHVLVTCKLLERWNQKCQDESETANWMLVNSKKCPKCSNRIEKNGGCNHMTCTQCRHHFCWQCMSDWNVHGYNRSCNAFELQQAEKKNKSHLDAKRELERYLHCFHRYKNHGQGQDFAEKSLRVFIEKQDDKEKLDSSFDWGAFKAALEQLVACRRLLKGTYVVAYYMQSNPVELALFQDHQGVLESFTERLSEITEKNYTEIDRSEMVNLTASVDTYIKHLQEYNVEDMDL